MPFANSKGELTLEFLAPKTFALGVSYWIRVSFSAPDFFDSIGEVSGAYRFACNPTPSDAFFPPITSVLLTTPTSPDHFSKEPNPDDLITEEERSKEISKYHNVRAKWMKRFAAQVKKLKFRILLVFAQRRHAGGHSDGFTTKLLDKTWKGKRLFDQVDLGQTKGGLNLTMTEEYVVPPQKAYLCDINTSILSHTTRVSLSASFGMRNFAAMGHGVAVVGPYEPPFKQEVAELREVMPADIKTYKALAMATPDPLNIPDDEDSNRDSEAEPSSNPVAEPSGDSDGDEGDDELITQQPRF